MITDLLPLLAFTAFVVIARNVFEAYVLDRAQHSMETEELSRVRSLHPHHGRGGGSRELSSR
jgi:hypothetical protein